MKFKNFICFNTLLIMTLNIHAELLLNDSDKLNLPLPLPYNGIEYSDVEINNFLDESIKNDLQPIIIFGGNWCPDCRIFAGTLNMPSIKKFIDEKFNVLHIDVGRYDINMDLMELFGIPPEKGVPRVLVFDLERNLINNSSTTEWTTARDRDPQEIFNFIQSMAQ